jgi:hypothetical protein
MTLRREAKWDEDENGLVTLIRERPAIRGPRSLGRWISFMMAPPRIRLDEVGSYAWLNMNGGIEVRGLAGLLHAEFGETVEPVNQRLGQLIRLLKRERFVSYVTAEDLQSL